MRISSVVAPILAAAGLTTSGCGLLAGKETPKTLVERVEDKSRVLGADARGNANDKLSSARDESKSPRRTPASAAQCRAQLEDTYARVLYPGTLRIACAGCHVEGGLAGTSALTFAPTAQGTTFDTLVTAATTPASMPSLLAEPSGAVEHGGGLVAAKGTAIYSALLAFSDAARDEAACVALARAAGGPDAPVGEALPVSAAQLGAPGRFPLASVAPVRIQLIEPGQMRALAETALGISLPEASRLPQHEAPHGLPNDRTSNRIEGAQTLLAYLDVATLAAERVDPGKVMTCAQPAPADKSACQKAAIAKLARPLFRKPLDTASLEAWAAELAADEGRLGAPTAVRRLVRKALFSPLFLYRSEAGAPDGSLHPKPLTTREVAERLSLALTRSAPDEALAAAAEDGSLARPEIVAAQARRLLATTDGKKRFVEFVFAWLGLNEVTLAAKAVALKETFPPALAGGMRREVEEFVTRLVFDRNAKVPDLLLAETTWVNRHVANLYGMALPDEGVDPWTDFREKSLAGTGRIGLLTLPLVLASSAKESGRSPMLRGDFITQRLLCRRYPTGTGLAAMTLPEREGASLRERFRIVEATPTCAGCHALLNVGFALETFDPMGRLWPAGVVPAEELVGEYAPIGAPPVAFMDAASLARGLAAHPDFSQCFVNQLTRFLAGRDLGATDEPAIDALVQGARADGLDIPAAVARIVSSSIFLQTQRP